MKVSLVAGALSAMGVVAQSALAVALPDVAAEFGLGLRESAWVLASFSVTFPLGLSVFGWMLHARGHRTVLVRGVTVFAAGCVAGMFANSYEQVLLARGLQGFGAGALPVAGLAIASAVASEAMQGRAVGVVTACLAVGSSTASLVGGLVTDLLGWRMVFGVPLLAIVAAVLLRRVAEPGERTGPPFDLRGTALLMVGFACVGLISQYAVVGAPPAPAWGLLLLLVLATAGLVRHVRRFPGGMLPARPLLDRTFRGASAASAGLAVAHMGMVWAVPILLSDQQGWGALTIGAVLLPVGVVAALAAFMAGRVRSPAGQDRLLTVAVGAGVGGLLIGAAFSTVAGLLLLGHAMTASAAFTGQTVGTRRASIDGTSFVGVYLMIVVLGGGVGMLLLAASAEVAGLPNALALGALLPAVGLFWVLRPPHSQPASPAW